MTKEDLDRQPEPVVPPETRDEYLDYLDAQRLWLAGSVQELKRIVRERRKLLAKLRRARSRSLRHGGVR